MESIGFLVSDRIAPGFRLAGVYKVRAASSLDAIRKELAAFASDTDLVLLVIEKALFLLLTKDEQQALLASKKPLTFIIDSSGEIGYLEQLNTALKRIGIAPYAIKNQ